jgi:hypothetical protein
VLNANTGIVCGRNYNGIVFKFYDNKDGFATGDAITFKANRITEPTVTRPTFLIVQTEVSKKSNLEKKFCSFEDGKVGLYLNLLYTFNFSSSLRQNSTTNFNATKT